MPQTIDHFAPSEACTTNHSRYNSTVENYGKPSRKGLVTRDRDIRKVLLADLRQKYNDKDHNLIVEEFGCNAARTDVAVINGSLHAFEIKSDSDSLDRLPSQVQAYQGVFEFITLVCGWRLLDRARVTVPKWWGLQKAECKDGTVVLRQLRAPKLNPEQDAIALAKMLWKTEGLACLRKYGHKVVTSKHTADEVAKAVADNIPLATLSNEVRQAIKIRGGSGFARQSIRDDDLCTIESTAQGNRLPDLSWLLSEQFQSRLD